MGDVEKELEEFKKFKYTFNYELTEVEEVDGVQMYDGEPLIDGNGREKGEGKN